MFSLKNDKKLKITVGIYYIFFSWIKIMILYISSFFHALYAFMRWKNPK